MHRTWPTYSWYYILLPTDKVIYTYETFWNIWLCWKVRAWHDSIAFRESDFNRASFQLFITILMHKYIWNIQQAECRFRWLQSLAISATWPIWGRWKNDRRYMYISNINNVICLLFLLLNKTKTIEYVEQLEPMPDLMSRSTWLDR